MRASAVSIVLFALLLATPAIALAGQVDPAPAQGADVSTPSSLCGVSSGWAQLSPLPMFDIGATSTCTAQATCADGRTISCSCNSSSCSCSATDDYCSSAVEGYVRCGSTTIYCDDCCTGPRSKCIQGLPCIPGCGTCAEGFCEAGTCYCGPIRPD